MAEGETAVIVNDEKNSLKLNGSCETIFKVPDIFSFPKTLKQKDLNSDGTDYETEKVVLKSPAEQFRENNAVIPYKEPSWSGLPSSEYSLEVLKGGLIVETVSLMKTFSVIGRWPPSDVIMGHPLVSRHHCVIQYRCEGTAECPLGFYVFDLGSTHGTFLNKHQLKPHVYYPFRVGHMLRVGGSTRTLILQGPNEDQEPESELSVTQLKEQAALKLKDKAAKLGVVKQIPEKESQHGEQEGIDWGMGEDAEEEADDAINPFSAASEELYLDDPKKTLRGWFEREGYDLPNYVCDDLAPGKFKCRVELPVPGPGGRPLVAVMEHSGKKKDTVVQCALEACRMLDRMGLLRQATHESHEKRKRDWGENDYYDSDEDEFLDRTGDVQRKRLHRMKGKLTDTENYETLSQKYCEVLKELVELEEKLNEAERLQSCQDKGDCGEGDDLDLFMQQLKAQVPDKHRRVLWKLRVTDLRKEEVRLRRLVNIARPAQLPEVQPYQYTVDLILSSKLDGGKHESPAAKSNIFGEEEPERKMRLSRLDDPTPEAVVKETKCLMKGAVKESKLKKEIVKECKLDIVKTTEDSGFDDKSENMIQMKDFTTCDREKDSDNILLDDAKSIEIGPDLIKSKVKFSHLSNSTIVTPPAQASSDEMIKPRVLGPTLPPNFSSRQTQKDKKIKSKMNKPKFDSDAPNYDSWVPPQDQRGDGRTALNDKLGY